MSLGWSIASEPARTTRPRPTQLPPPAPIRDLQLWPVCSPAGLHGPWRAFARPRDLGLCRKPRPPRRFSFLKDERRFRGNAASGRLLRITSGLFPVRRKLHLWAKTCVLPPLLCPPADRAPVFTHQTLHLEQGHKRAVVKMSHSDRSGLEYHPPGGSRVGPFSNVLWAF